MLDLILLLLTIGITVYVWLTWNYDYWQKQGVPYVKPSLIFGTTKGFTTCRENMGVVLKKFYEQFDEPAVGLFKMRQPQLMIRDMDLVKTILIRDSNTFKKLEKLDPILAINPFIIKGEKWQKMRSLHTQQHTSSKIKSMFSFMKDVNKDMIKYLDEKQGDKIDSKYFCGQYTTDVVGSCVYGLHANSFVDPDAKFRKVSAKLFKPETFLSSLNFVLFHISPKLSSALKFNDEITNFFHGIVRDVRDHRLKHNIVRNDFLGSLMEENKKENPIVNSLEKITGHTLTFVFDGYETSSTVMGLTLYILSIYQDIQQKLRHELNNAENLEYDTIHRLAYLDAVIDETLRMFPPAPLLSRVCIKDTEVEFNDKKYIFKKGMTALIPILAIHMDSEHFQNPEVFNPERFYKQPPSPYILSFGMGPRACLGQRFVLTQLKIGLAHIIKNFRVLPVLENAKFPEISPKSPILVISKDPMWVKFEKIKLAN